MRNFFRELRNCEESVLSEDALFINLAGQSEPYQEGTKKTLCELISLVSSGMIKRKSCSGLFGCWNCVQQPVVFPFRTFAHPWGRLRAVYLDKNWEVAIFCAKRIWLCQSQYGSPA